MNERIKELAEQAGFEFNSLGGTYTTGTLSDNLEKFAALVQAKARADEREACAKLCESHVRQPSRLHFAAAIRARGTT